MKHDIQNFKYWLKSMQLKYYLHSSEVVGSVIAIMLFFGAIGIFLYVY